MYVKGIGWRFFWCWLAIFFNGWRFFSRDPLYLDPSGVYCNLRETQLSMWRLWLAIFLKLVGNFFQWLAIFFQGSTLSRSQESHLQPKRDSIVYVKGIGWRFFWSWLAIFLNGWRFFSRDPLFLDPRRVTCNQRETQLCMWKALVGNFFDVGWRFFSMVGDFFPGTHSI